MPRHPPNAQKNKTQTQPKTSSTTDHTPTQPGGGAARATQRTKILASTIQITTNPPTAAPHQHTTSRTPHRPHQGAPPQNPTAHPPPNPPHTTSEKKTGQDAQPHHTHAPQTPRRPQQPPRTRAHAAGTARRVPCTTNPAPHRRQTPRSTTPPENRPPAYGRQRPCPPASPPEEKAP